MIRERLDNWCERGIFVLVLAVLVFGPLATGAVRPPEFLVIQGLTVAAVLLWVLRFWLSPNPRLLWPPVCWAVVAFVLYALIRYHQADIEYVARQELIRILVYALLFFIVLNNLARQDFTQVLSCVVVFLGMAISMYAIYQFATDSQYVWHFIKPAGYHKRGSGTYICPNHLAGFLEMLVPLGLAYALTHWRRAGDLFRVADPMAAVSHPGVDRGDGPDGCRYLFLFESGERSKTVPQHSVNRLSRHRACPFHPLETDFANVA